ncbi:MAG: hypothetical protein ACFB2X_01395 [Rivularia sp. (in: cyanobacteria)]
MKQLKSSQLRSPLSSSFTPAQNPIILNDSKYDSRSTTASSWVSLRLPTLKQIGRFALWGTGRLSFSGFLFTLDAASVALSVTQTLIKWTRQSAVNLLKIYDQLPYNGTHSKNLIEATAVEIFEEPEEIITDVVEAIEGKQVMVIGEMGTGKSTLAQYLAYTVGGQVKVYECEGTPDDWQGLEVIGKGENWNAIAAGMGNDLDDLSHQMKIREQQGDKALDGTEKVIICEEYPEMPSKVSVSDEWLARHARRGRKARRFTILLSQYDRVAAWGLEGKSDLADAFWRIRLGKKAISHAKSLKNDELIAWLKQDRSHCLLDDTPCKLPPYREMKAVISRPFSNQGIAPQKTG